MQAPDITEAYRRHAPAVFRRARQILGIDADAHEVVQDIFLSLYQKPEQFQNRSSLTTFLYSATTHACLNRLRNEKNRQRLRRERLDLPTTSEAVDHRLTPEQLLMLQRVLQQMPEDLAQAAVYYLVDGLTHQEIAQLMGCSRRHVGNLLERVENYEEQDSTC